MKDRVNFSELEVEKENVTQLREGRSARRLLDVLSQNDLQLQETRNDYERKLAYNTTTDNTLDLYMDYIEWINHAYPQGGTSSQSGMLDVMERCLKRFKDDPSYKNDIRYLKIWLDYIRMFHSESLTESMNVFVYLYRNRIGNELVLFYLEFSEQLIKMGKLKEALYMLQTGVESVIDEKNLLLQKVMELSSDLQEQNIVAQDIEEYFDSEYRPLILDQSRQNIIRDYKERRKKLKTPNVSSPTPGKYRIFNDEEEDETDESSNFKFKIYDDNTKSTFESKHNKSKENQLKGKVLGEDSNLGIIKQVDKLPHTHSNKQNFIFNDNLGRTDPVYKLIHIRDKKPEKIDCNFDLIYRSVSEEFSIEELLAISRNVYGNIKKRTVEDNHDGVKRFKS